VSKPKLKSKVTAKAKESKEASGKSIMESAQQIWLAGLGAFSKAQGEGSRVFDTLIKEGMGLEQKTRKIATGTADDVRGAVESGVSQMRERTQETWDRLEQVFESRVSRALSKLGVPGKKEIDELLKRVEELGREVKKANPVVERTVTRNLNNTMRRARDDLSDLVKDIEDAQLAARQAMRPAPKPMPAVKPAPAPAATHKPAPGKPAPAKAAPAKTAPAKAAPSKAAASKPASKPAPSKPVASKPAPSKSTPSKAAATKAKKKR
jgi:poly(hydroxyalkanoate) granule-associated protein